MGLYVYNAVSVAVQNSLYGRKSKAKYIENPITESEEYKKKNKKNEELTEEEKKRERNNLLMKLKLMQANFEINHKQDG